MRVGILGGGQLAQMLTQAAVSLGIETAIYERQPNSPASRLTHVHAVGGWEEVLVLEKFASHCDLLTLENEFVYADSLAHLESKGFPVYPSSNTLRIIQDKLLQKQCFVKANLPVPYFEAIESPDDLKRISMTYGYPFVLKARYGGYDGYGNATINEEREIAPAWEHLSHGGRKIMVEAFVPFLAELAVMIVRGRDGEIRAYPVVETVQKNHICHVVRAPAPLDMLTTQEAKDIAIKAVEALDGVGIFGVELFLLPNGTLILNEVAPRPHNSGHYSIEACLTSQFENHLRAVLGYPLGETAMIAPCAVMVNVLGTRNGALNRHGIQKALRVAGAHVHLYGKSEVRIGRKVGHVTVLSDSLKDAESRARQAVDSMEV